MAILLTFPKISTDGAKQIASLPNWSDQAICKVFSYGFEQKACW